MLCYFRGDRFVIKYNKQFILELFDFISKIKILDFNRRNVCIE